MADITQRLGFEAAGAIKTLGELQVALSGVNRQLTRFNKVASGTSGAQAAAQSFNRLQQQTQSANQALRNTSNQFNRTGQTGAQAGRDITISWETMIRVVQTQLIVRALNELIRLFSESAEAARDFQITVARISTIADGAGDSIDSLGLQVNQLSRQLGLPVQELAEAAFETLQRDIGDTAESFQFLATAGRLAVSQGSDVQDAVTTLSSVLTAFNRPASEAENIADALFVAVDRGNVTLDQMANRLGTVNPLAARLGTTFDETAASIAAITLSGTNTNISMTQLRNVLQKLIRPSEELQGIFKRLGVTTGQELVAASGGLVPALQRIADEVNNDEQALADAFNTIRGNLGVLNLLAENGELVSSIMEDMADKTGRAASAFETIDATNARELDRATAGLNQSITELGNVTLGARTAFVRFFDETVQGLIVIGDLLSANNAARRERLGIIAESIGQANRQQTQETNALRSEAAERANILNAALAQAEANAARQQSIATAAQNRITQTVNASISSFEKSRKAAIKAIENAVVEMDNRIKGSQKQVADLEQELSDRAFKRDIRRLSTRQKAERTLQRGQETTEKGLQQLSEARNDEQIEAAREILDLGRDQLRQAEALAKQSGNRVLQRQFEEAINEEIKNRIDAEKDLQKRTEETRDTAEQEGAELITTLQAQQAEVERLGIKAAESKDALRELFTVLSDTPQTDLAESLGIQKLLNQASTGLAQSLAQANVNWTLVVDSLESAIADRTLEATVRLSQTGDEDPLGRALSGVGEGPDPAANIRGQVAALEEFIQGQINARAEQTKLQGQVRATVSQVQNLANTDLFGDSLTRVASGFEQIFSVITTGEGSQAQAQLENVSQRLFSIGEAIPNASREDLAAISKGLQDLNKDASTLTDNLSAEQAAAFFESFNLLLDAVRQRGAVLDSESIIDSNAEAAARERLKQIENQLRQNIPAAATSAKNSVSGIGTQMGTVVAQTNSATAAMGKLAAAAQKALAASSAANSAAGAAHFGGRPLFRQAGGLTRGADTRLVAAQPGEMFVNARQSRNFFSELQAINAGQRPQFREAGGPVTNVGDINVTVNQQPGERLDGEAIARSLKRTLRRSTSTIF